ncbi:MAG: XRE family transcriptional regulator [Treponema sp.]|jgi:transcriptional regulator with XRE-family HTH domain|nr:XRE family transcriptional regulator [Treponema sp.]
MDDADLFWENIKKEIRQQNTTQEWVAKQAGISFNTFQGWINKSIFPRVNEAARIAAALNASIEFFISGTIRNNRDSIGKISRELSEIYTHLEVISKTLREL